MSFLRYIDTHVHLHTEPFDVDREVVVERATAAGVQRLIEVGYDLASSRAALALAERYPQIHAAIGIQPHYAQEADARWLNAFA